MHIKMKDVCADYEIGPIRSPLILNGVNLTINDGTFAAVVGHTGAGKSSLLKMFNGLIIPKKGMVQVGDYVIDSQGDKKVLKEVRKKVGMVFQFPESQLFAETVEQDIIFGPLNFGVPINEAKSIAAKVIEMVGLDKSILSKSPFSLSGGQKRRVAIAGILAMEPQVLVLDEPGAGLDPVGKKEIMSFIRSWHDEKGLTTILVTHDMEDVAEYADEVVVMEKGKIVLHDDVHRVFSQVDQLKKWHLDLPNARRFQLKIEQETGISLPRVCLTLEELTDALIEVGLA